MITTNNNFWLRSPLQIKSIATLGPRGSSSQCAAWYLSKLIRKQLEVLLFDTLRKIISQSRCAGDIPTGIVRSSPLQGSVGMKPKRMQILLEKNCQGKAGYCKTGKIKPKRYRIVDLQEHRFIDGTGEVIEF